MGFAELYDQGRFGIITILGPYVLNFSLPIIA